MSAGRPSRPLPRRGRRRLRAGLLVAIGLLYALSIPWYRSPGAEPVLVGGLPDWVAVALLCYAAAAVLNALAWLVAELPEDPAPAGPPAAPAAQAANPSPEAARRRPTEGA